MLYLVSAGGVFVVDAGGENFIFWLSRTQENAILDTFSKNFVFVLQMFFVQQKSGRPMYTRPPVAWALCMVNWGVIWGYDGGSRGKF